LHIGTQNFGMGHETVYAQVLSERLQVPFDAIEMIDGDTDSVPRGAGSHGSRSMRVGGEAIMRCVHQVVDRARVLAAQMLQADADDLRFTAGEFVIDGSERAVSLFEVAAFAASNGDPLSADADFEQQRESFSSGCHVCEVSIDTDTGKVSLLRHVLVTDVGAAINPMIVHGQIHGGAAQGIGQAAMEEVIYDLASGQTITGSLMDYTLPRADDLPFFVSELAHTRETDNELGVKGVGEGPTTGAPAAYMNAVHDALAQVGAGTIDMPASAEKVWRALREAR
jgi:carbon-monoxide dehydrogenase large subunit